MNLVLIFLVATILQAVSPQGATNGAIELSVSSFWTNYSVPATITVRLAKGGTLRTLATDDFGRLRLDLPVGEYQFTVAAPGFETMESHSPSEPGRVLPIGFVLSPLQEPEELQKEAALLRPGFTLISGWAVDEGTGKPLANVSVRPEQGRAQVLTNARGYFVLFVPSPPVSVIQGIDLPGLGTVIAELAGYKTIVARNLMLPDGRDSGLNLLLKRGSGTVEEDHKNHLYPPD